MENNIQTENNIVFERIWQDADFYELLMTFSNEIISVKTEIYTDDALIDDLHNKIDSLLQNDVSEIYWQSGERGDRYVPCVSMRMERDKHGHIQIEVYAEIDDGGSLSKHNCCFYLKTEIMALSNFNRRLLLIKNPVIGTRIQLID